MTKPDGYVELVVVVVTSSVAVLDEVSLRREVSPNNINNNL